MVYTVRTGQNQCQVIRYLDECSHVSENVCKVHLVMAFVAAGGEIAESLGPHGRRGPDVRFLGTTIAFFLPAQDVLDVWGLE